MDSPTEGSAMDGSIKHILRQVRINSRDNMKQKEPEHCIKVSKISISHSIFCFEKPSRCPTPRILSVASGKRAFSVCLPIVTTVYIV